MGQNFNFSNTPAQGLSVAPGITAATVVKPAGGRVMAINVNVVSSAGSVFSVYDSSTLAGTAASNLVYAANITTAVTVGTQIDLLWPVTSGIVVVPGTGANVAASYL